MREVLSSHNSESLPMRSTTLCSIEREEQYPYCSVRADLYVYIYLYP